MTSKSSEPSFATTKIAKLKSWNLPGEWIDMSQGYGSRTCIFIGMAAKIQVRQHKWEDVWRWCPALM
jgi:hypothetical protein